MNEIWKDIQGFEGKYQVSNMGRVRSLDMTVHNPGRSGDYFQKGRILVPYQERNGYLRVTLINGDRSTKQKISIHRLVAIAFVGGYAEGLEVNHIDEVRTNNRADNLEWVTCKQNINHGNHNRRMSLTKGKRVMQIALDGEIVSVFPSLSDASRETGIKRENIGKVCNHRKGFATAGGFRWEFENQ